MEKSEFVVREHGGINPQTESPRLVAQHASAYEFVKQFAKGRLLEVGIGDGYGSHFLSQYCDEVVGIDLFEKNVIAAQQKYPKKNLTFKTMNATEITFPANSFDYVVSFQVIEHIPQALLKAYIDSIKRVTKNDGQIIITTLNLKKNLKPGKPYDKSPHHDKEFTPEEFKQFLSPHFRQITLYGLFPTTKHSIMERLKKMGLSKIPPLSQNRFEWGNFLFLGKSV